METKQIKGLTDLEKQVLNATADMMYAEWGFSDVGATEISEAINVGKKVVRGVLSSLVKKGYLTIEGRENTIGYKSNDPSWEPIVHLDGDAQALVEHWQGYIGYKAEIV
jgi:hypothetical protein